MGYLCTECRGRHLGWQCSSLWGCTLWTVGNYEGVLKNCITSVKNRGHKALAEDLVDAVTELVRDGLAPKLRVDAVFAVPPSQQGQRFRGFSLPASLETKLVERLGWEPLEISLRRSYRSSTKTSKGLTASQRLARAENLVSEAAPPEIDRGTLLLIDDVVTTASTMGRCVKQAKSQGFSEIICLALAEHA